MLHATSRATRIALGVSVITAVAFAPTIQAQKSGSSPNYELASAWTSQKVSKLVFDTSITPRWLETSDRFWYTYQTREGRRFHIVDPVKRTKGALFDHARMAAALTTITRIPYDAQHLPFTQVALHQGGFGIRIRSAGASRREHRDDQAKAHHHRATAAGPGSGAGDSGLGRPEKKRIQCSKASGAGAPERVRHPTHGRKRSTSNTTWRRRR